MSTSLIATLQQPLISPTHSIGSRLSLAAQPIEPSLTLTEFHRQMQRECCDGSAISPALYQAAVTLISDVELLPGGEVDYPIHAALGHN